jgi:hypothetical protein
VATEAKMTKSPRFSIRVGDDARWQEVEGDAGAAGAAAMRLAASKWGSAQVRNDTTGERFYVREMRWTRAAPR